MIVLVRVCTFSDGKKYALSHWSKVVLISVNVALPLSGAISWPVVSSGGLA